MSEEKNCCCSEINHYSIKKALIERDMKQVELAKILGVAPQVLNRVSTVICHHSRCEFAAELIRFWVLNNSPWGRKK